MSRPHRVAALAVALLLVVTASVGSVAAQPTQEDGGDGVPTADDAYVTDGGSVVLVYHNDTDEASRVEYGLDVSESVFHALVVSNGTDTDVTGEATAVLDPDGMNASGSFAAPQPDAVTSLTFDASGETTDQNSQFDASVAATLNDTAAAPTSLVEGATASATVQLAPETFTASGQFDADLRAPLGSPQHRSFSLRETDGGYVLDGAQNYTVRGSRADAWSTEERARQTLQAQYGAVAASLGGTSDVTLESYAYEETATGARVDVAFTAEYSGVDEGLQRTIATQLSNSETYDLTREQAQQVAGDVADLRVEEMRLRYDLTRERASGEFTARLSNYAGAVRSAFAVANATDTESDIDVASQLDRLQKTFEARQESGLVETVSADVTVESPRTEPTTVDASVSYRTENWAAYREALKARGIDPATVSYDLHAETKDDEIVADGSATFEQEHLLRRSSNAVLNATDPEDTEARRFVRAFKDAKLRKARMDVSLADGQVRVEMGAAFENLASLRDAVTASTGSTLKVGSAVGRTSDGEVNSYVTLRAAVSANATESDVRALAPVGERTTVHMPGTYNRTFPETDVQGAYDYLGLDHRTPTGSGSGAVGQPGFGIGVAALALLGAALLAARRDDES